MKQKLEYLFQKKGWNFQKWLKKNNLRVYYTVSEVVNSWIPKFEEIGSFSRVGEYFKVDPATIQSRIEEILGEGFFEWYKDNAKRDIYQSVGIYAHYLFELLFMEFMEFKGLFSMLEVKPSPVDNDNVCDNIAYLDKNYEYAQWLRRKLFANILLLVVDYTLSSERITFVDKSKKGYHGGPKYLIVISLITKNENIPIPANAVDKPKLKILNAAEFSDFIGYTGEFLERYNEYVRLIRSAIYNKDSYQYLEHLAEESNHMLLTKYGNFNKRQERFENFLINETEGDLSYL